MMNYAFGLVSLVVGCDARFAQGAGRLGGRVGAPHAGSRWNRLVASETAGRNLKTPDGHAAGTTQLLRERTSQEDGSADHRAGRWPSVRLALGGDDNHPVQRSQRR